MLGAMIARLLMLLIRVYQQTLSRLLGPVCRFEPSCSRYTHECLRLHGAAKGSYLGFRRIIRCHPFHPGGYDPPPVRGLRGADSVPKPCADSSPSPLPPC